MSKISLSAGGRFGKNVIFGVENNSVHADNRRKDILNLGRVLKDRLDDTTVVVEAEYSITEIKEFFGLHLHFNESNSFLLINDIKICQFKAKDYEINVNPLCIGNIFQDLSVGDMEKAGPYGCL